MQKLKQSISKVLEEIIIRPQLIVDSIRTNKMSSKGTPAESIYKMDDKFEHVANIPKDKYLHKTELPKDKEIFDVRDFGASTNSSPTDNNIAISKAIDKASAVNGIVFVDGGTYRSTRIQLKSNITLKIQQDSALENITFDECIKLNQQRNMVGFLNGSEIENVTIEGPGKLKGNGETYCLPQKDSTPFYPLNTFNLKKYVLEHRKRIKMGKVPEMSRDFLIGIRTGKNINIKNIEVFEAGSWTIRLEGIENLKIEDIVIDNDVRVANSDGIDIMGGKDVLINHCFIATGDDGICPKTDPYTPGIENLTVTNCEVMSLANCFKIGTACYFDIKNVVVKDCYFFQPGIAGGYAGIAIESPSGATVSDIYVENIKMDNITSPFVIWRGGRNGDGKLKNVTIKNITANNCDIGGAISGYKDKDTKEIRRVENVQLNNICVNYRNNNEKLHCYPFNGKALDCSNNLYGYPEITKVSHYYIISNEKSLYYDLPTSGLFVRYADGVTIDNYKVKTREKSKLPLCNYENKSMKNKNITVINSDLKYCYKYNSQLV